MLFGVVVVGVEGVVGMMDRKGLPLLNVAHASCVLHERRAQFVHSGAFRTSMVRATLQQVTFLPPSPCCPRSQLSVCTFWSEISKSKYLAASLNSIMYTLILYEPKSFLTVVVMMTSA